MKLSKIKLVLKTLKKKIRRFNLILQYNIQLGINGVAFVTNEDGYLGISTFLIQESNEHSMPIICKNYRDKLNLLRLAEDKCGAPIITVLTVEEILKNRFDRIYHFTPDTVYLSDCLSVIEIEKIKKRGLKVSGFVRVSK